MKQSTKPQEASIDPLIGQTLGGKYSIVRMIGRGGVGLVYLARCADPPRDVVVKVLAPHWASDPEALKRFDREANRLRGLNHPNIVEMLGAGHDGDRAYLVMEYLQGELLSDHVARKRRLTLEEFVPIAAQILKGIGHAHSRELMVRDVKPANVMLCERKGRANFVKILDFGLAKLLRGEQAITEEHVMGTVGYLAPEAIKGEPIDLRVDVYAIGVLFYYMLAGRLPFEGESNAAVFYKTINEQPRDLAELLGQNHGLPRGLIDLVHSCLEKDRNARPADADRVVERLIDVVPASLFRLPRAATEKHGIPVSLAPGVGNTGLMELIGSDHSPSNELPLEPGTPTPPPGTLRPISSPLPAAAATETGRSALINFDQLDGQRRTMSLVAISVVAGALAAILVAGLILVLLRDDDDKPQQGGGNTVAAATTASESGLAASLDDIDARIGRGDLDGAVAALDRIRDKAKDDSAAFARVELADKHIRIARLLADAAARETEGDTAAAIVGYRDILALDPKHAPARAALARLEATPAEPSPTTPSPPGIVEITSRPVANLYIDGAAAGTTPYRKNLSGGRHKVKMTARGYHTWEGTIDVDEQGTLPLAVTLRGKGPGKGGNDAAPTGTPDPVPSTSPPPSSPPDTPATEPTRQPDKKDPFLPTKPSGKPGSSGDPFLPTKKP